MSDFYDIVVRTSTKGFEILPRFDVRAKTKDLMVKKDFYAFYNEETGLWSKNEDDVIDTIDKAMVDLCKTKGYPESAIRFMKYSDTGSIDGFHKAVQKQMRSNYSPLDRRIIFADETTTREDHASMKLPYSLSDGDCPAYDELMSTLYAPEERDKLEWAIGAIISGDSRKIQKFIVVYGEGGSGKGTVLEIISDMFTVEKGKRGKPSIGYCQAFRVKDICKKSDRFSLSALSDNPLIAIDFDADLSQIEDNTKLNSLVSHDKMILEEKMQTPRPEKFECFVFVASNSRVKITDANSGLIRRLIDVEPSGKRIPTKRYDELRKAIKFEYGVIAKRCLEKYKSMGKDYYKDYRSHRMISETNVFYDFLENEYFFFRDHDPIGLEKAWERYKMYAEASNIQHKMSRMSFGAELKRYYKHFYNLIEIEGINRRNLYSGFIKKKFNFEKDPEEDNDKEDLGWLDFEFHDDNPFDEMCKDFPAQYAGKDGNPTRKWINCKTVLSDLDSTKLHWLKPPSYIICVDFDLKENGEKSFKLNAEAAAEWPMTYAELSKSGEGIHLYYIYYGDIKELANKYSTNVEIKVFSGDASLRRKVTRHNNYCVATISSGLPMKEKGGNKVINWKGVNDEKHLRNIILGDLQKKYCGYTYLSVQHIYETLEEAFKSGISYDVRDMQHDIVIFGAHSSNQSDNCQKLIAKMKFISEDLEKAEYIQNFEDSRHYDEHGRLLEYVDERFVFFDIECYPNLLLICWKFYGNPIITRWRNPEPEAVEMLGKFKLIGFNCRDYDNHVCGHRIMGGSIEHCYDMSQKIISSPKGSNEGKLGQFYNWSYADIFSYSSKKQSLKKWEIEMGETHMEMGIRWDEPVPDDMLDKVEEYCCNDVLATEKLFDYIRADFDALLMLVEMANIFAPNITSIPNDKVNTLTARIVFEGNKEPQSQFLYRDLAEPVHELDLEVKDWLWEHKPDMMKYWASNSDSLLPYFPDYTYTEDINEAGKVIRLSEYKGVKSGEGGYVYAEPGMYYDVITFDVASEHPSSVEDECLFGPRYTDNFHQIKQLRIYIKHKDFEAAKRLFGGKLAHLLNDTSKSKSLAQALKIAINAVYGQTAAHFKNPFKDDRNIDNIVAKRGALFMIDLVEEVKKRGGHVIHCKTDSIKVVDPSKEVSDFIIDFGRWYGYDFEIEHIYERICLVNNSVYVAKLDVNDEDWIKDCEDAKKEGKPEPTRWTFTGTQFDVPYVRKTLFTHEPIEFKDLCETKSVQKGAIYVNCNENNPDEDNYIFVGRVGQFTPVETGAGGGELICFNEPRIGNVTGTKGYRWMESAMVKALHLEDKIDMQYYRNLADKAIETIEKFGNYSVFSDNWINVPEDAPEEIPFEEVK